MNKQILSVVSMSLLTVCLIGCTRNEVGTAGGAAVGAGVGYAATGGSTVGSVVGAGVGALVGHVATNDDMRVYRSRGVVVRDGYSYHIQNGRYVIVH